MLEQGVAKLVKMHSIDNPIVLSQEKVSLLETFHFTKLQLKYHCKLFKASVYNSW